MDNPNAGSRGHSAVEPKRPQRPREMQDWLNYYMYHPLAWQLAKRLAKTPLTPNMVSVIGGLFVVAAGLVYFTTTSVLGAVIGMALHMTWHVVDGADGDLARITGKTSPFGEMVDGICDYVSHIVVYFLLAFVLQRTLGGWAWVWMVPAGLSHIVQSNHVEVQRRFYQYWMYGVPWLHHARSNDDGLFNDKRGIDRVFQLIAHLYLQLAAGMTPHALQVDEAVTAAANDPARLAAIRAEVQRENRPLLFILKLLGPNPRAIVLGFSMIAGSPVYFFFYQAVVLNLLLALSVVLHNRAAQRVAATLDAAGLLVSSPGSAPAKARRGAA